MQQVSMSDLLHTVQTFCQQAIAVVKAFSARAPGTITTQALGVGALVGYLAYRLMKKRYRLPPGPRPLPLLGNLLSMRSGEQLYMKLAHWAREEGYGPVISIYFGPVLCVTLNDLQSVNEALVHKGSDFAGRPYLFSLNALSAGSKDIVFADYTPAWNLHRKISLQAIKHYMTGSHLEKVVHETMAMVTEEMAEERRPFDPHSYNTMLMFHIIDFICFGESKSYYDPSILKLVHLFESSECVGNGFLEDIVPLLRYRPTKKFINALAAFQKYWDYLDLNIQNHRERFTPDNVRDITDSLLLAQMEAAREESAEVMAMFTDVHLRETVSDLFGVGVDTSRFTLDWAMLFMAGHPEVQKRAQTEIDAATGDRMPGVGDRGKLQYTEAVLYETMRLGSVAPSAVPHKTLCDTTVGGYDVPKGTMVLVNLWAVLHDPDLWHQPDLFKPERFLDDQGKLKTKPEGWIPFSAGRRACLGETVAKPELLLLLACFLKRFTFSLPKGAKFKPDHELAGFLIHVPKAYRIVVSPR